MQKNILHTSSITVGHSQDDYDRCVSFKYGIIHKVKSPASGGSFSFSGCCFFIVCATASLVNFFFQSMKAMLTIEARSIL